MKLLCVVFYLFIFMDKVSPQTLDHLNKKSTPVVDALIHRLESEEWADDEEACFKGTLRILNGVKNDTLWATWIWDSMQPPVGVFYGTGFHLGNFDQCVNTPWSSQSELSTQYCLVEVRGEEPREPNQFDAYDSATEYLNTLSTARRKFLNLGFGVCMPGVCSPLSIVKIFKHMLQLSHIPDIKDIRVNTSDCQTAEQKPYPWKFYTFLYVCGALFGFAVISTIYSNRNDAEGNSKIDEIAKSFNITHNWKDLFKVNKNEIKVLNGMKVFTAMLVVSIHQGLFSLFTPNLISNSAEVDVMFRSEFGEGVCHLDLIVDTFFPISGLLLVKGLISGRQKNLLTVLIKRYFRLIGPYAVVTFYILCMARCTTTGPIWQKTNLNEGEVCEKHWWKNFFMLGYNIETMCFGVAWYVNCDYHLAILTVLLIWIYRRSKRTAVISFIGVSFLLTAQLAVMAYRKRIPLVPFLNSIDLTEIRNYEVMNDVYIRWHDRAGSYLVGIAMGWFMSLYKPADYRNTINKTNSYIILLISLYVMMKAATINHWLRDGSRLEVAIGVATNRVAWSIAICSIIAACEYGSLSAVNHFLGSRFFVPISKLSYGIYMTHFFLLQRSIHSVRSSYSFDLFNAAIVVFGTSVLSCIVSLVLYLLVEAPCINLSNVWLSESPERTDKAELNVTKSNGTMHQNGTNGLTTQTNGITKLKEL